MNALLLIDERRGRGAAIHENVSIIGTARLLVAAKKRGFLMQVAPALTALRQNGYRFDDAIVEYIVSQADESPGLG